MILEQVAHNCRPAACTRQRRCLTRVRAAQAPSPALPLSFLPDSSPLAPSFRATTTAPTFQPTTGGCPQYAPAPPQLLSRSLTLNPLHALVAALEGALGSTDRAVAAVLDRRPLTHLLAAAVTGALTFWGLHPLALRSAGGLPPALADWLEARVGDWAVEGVGVAVLALGLAAAAWQLRTWAAAQLALFRLEPALQRSADARDSTATAAEDDDEAAAVAGGASSSSPSSARVEAGRGAGHGPFSGLVPAGLRGMFEADWKATDKSWLYVLLAARLVSLLTAATSLLVGATSRAAGYAALCFATSLAPLALPHMRHLAATAPPMRLPGGAAALAGPVLLADIAFPLALSPATPPPVRAAAAAALTLGLGLAALEAAASPRLDSVRAAAGDVATFHLTLRLPTNGTLIDTTWGHMPLTAVVGDAVQPAAAAAATGDAAASVCDPHARFRPVQELVAGTTLDGMLLGERRRVAVVGGDDGSLLPFGNPGLVWWQPREDLERKVGSGARVQPGDVFWYPVGSLVSALGSANQNMAAAAAVASLPGSDSWGPVKVAAVAGEWVQLDANEGMWGGDVEVEVALLSLEKTGGA